MPTYKWTSIKKLKDKQECTRFEVSSHPLKLVHYSPGSNFIDKINKWSAAFEEPDPLLRFERLNSNENIIPEEEAPDKVDYAKAWNTRHVNILSKYTTGEKLTIISSFLPGGEKTLIRQVSNLNEKVKHRLEQLDDFDEGSVRKTIGLSQQEFITKINMLNDEMKKAWGSEQRVKAFKIAIQCSKLLSDVNVMQFYPSKFVLITDILDMFGDLVFERLRQKSFGLTVCKNIEDIDPAAVPESAKETCQNWIFKMASIRELLPRLYMEMSLLKCYAFISKEEIKPSLARLTKMIRGIGNPLVAVYLRVYLCKVASKLLSKGCEEYFHSNFKEFIDDYQQIFSPMMVKKYESQLLTRDKYLNLYIPAVQDWLLFGTLIDTKCKHTLLEEFLKQCKHVENNELMLSCIVTAFDSASIVNKAPEILELMQNCSDKMVMVHEVLTSLGTHLCSADSYSHLASEALIKTWWKIASNIKTTSHFLQVLAPWLQFSCVHLSSQHINIILRGTIRYLIKCGHPVDEYAAFQSVIKRMLNYIPDVEELFLMDAFMPLLELVQTSNARTAMAKTVLSVFCSRYSALTIEDPIVISSLMRLSCVLHDSISAVTVEDECKACAELINKFVQLVSFQENLEQQLNFYVECRSAFIKLDAVLVTLVHAVNRLCCSSAGTGRERWLQRACAAYCFVTVPSLRCALARPRLYLLCGQVALANCCLGQAEANLKAFVNLLPDIPEYIVEDGQKKSTNFTVGAMINDFLSTVLILPDNVDSHCKAYILSGFIKSMDRMHWKKMDPLYYTTQVRILDLLCEMTQENYAYGIESVISNDKLYGNDPEFIEVLEQYATDICQELLVILKALGDSKENRKQYNLSLELFWRVIRRADLQAPPMMSLAANLWLLSQKLSESDNRLAKTMISALEKNSTPSGKYLLQKLLESSRTS